MPTAEHEVQIKSVVFLLRSDAQHLENDKVKENPLWFFTAAIAVAQPNERCAASERGPLPLASHGSLPS